MVFTRAFRGSFLVIYYIYLVLFKTHFRIKCLITSKGYYKVIVLNVHARVILSVHYLVLHTFRYNSSMRFGNDFKITIEKLEGSFYFPLEVFSMIQGVIWSLSCLEVGIMNCGIRIKQIQMCKLSIEI